LGELLPRSFFDDPAVAVAPRLLGCVLSAYSADGVVAVRVTEVEAYMGEADPASHAYHGRTRRNGVMYGEPGHAYVYFTYGMHFCVNLVCQPEGTASAVLLRAGAVVAGSALARRRRLAARRPGAGAGAGGGGGSGLVDRDLARGPARLCQALSIDRAFDGADVCDPAGALRVSAGAAAGAVDAAGGAAGVAPGQVRSGPRVGVSTAATVPWRFWIAGDPSVSAYRAWVPRLAKPSTPR
jgi:DNA-3-methyladenine glycosylase